MKARTKQCGVFAALAAVLLLSAALITSCLEPLNLGGFTTPQVEEQTPFVPPEGMGYVRLIIGGGNARTIRPDAGDFITDPEDFLKFDVSFTAVSPGTGTTVTKSNIIAADGDSAYDILTTTPYTLIAGQYNVEIWAYATTGATAKTGAVAYGKSTSLTVVAGVGGSASIILKEIADTYNTGGKGTFVWSLTSNVSITEVLLTLTTYPGNAAVTGFTGEDITGNLSGVSATADLDPGFYLVSLALSGTGVKIITVPEVLHIYQGMTSTYTATLPTLSSNVYTITFDPNGGDAYTPTGTAASVTHGSLITAPTNEPTRTDYQFGGWYKESGATNEWVFATDYPIRDTTLYAKWTSTTGTRTISISVANSAPNLPAFAVTDDDDQPVSTASISRTNPQTIFITVNNASGFTGDWTWFHNGEELAEDGDILELDLSDIDYLLAGVHTISASAISTASGQPEINAITFTIAND